MPPKKRDEQEEGEEVDGDTSGSEDLVSASDDEDGDEDELEGDDGGPQEAVPDDGEGSDFDELQVDFEFFDLKPVDFHGLRSLLMRYLDGELPFALSDLVELLIGQANSVGTTIKANGDVDPLGVVSVLPLDLHREHAAVQQVLQFISRKCTDDKVATKLKQACAARHVGLVVSERMINIPPELAPPLVDGLFEEIADIGGEWWWKTEKAPTQALRQAYEFEQLLILTRVYRDDDDEHNPADCQRAGPSQAKKAKQEPPPGKQKLIYPKPEDEAFHAHATWSFLFPAAVPEPSAVADRANKVTQMRLVMCVPASVAAAVRAQTRQLVASAGQKDK